MTGEAKTEYSLPRDATETSRLNYQHPLFVSSAGFLIHPRIAADLQQRPPNDVRIADIATGSGVWLLDVADKFPSAWSLTGLDISDAQFPTAPSSAGSRVQFGTLNILEPIPMHYRARFDFVHVRLLVCGLSSHDWPVAAQNLAALLKPGGWLQWQEFEAHSFAAVAAHNCSSPTAPTGDDNRALVQKFLAAMARVGQLQPGDAQRIPAHLAAAGLTNLASHCPASDREPTMRRRASEIVIGAVVGGLTKLVQHDPEVGLTQVSLDELATRAREEIAHDEVYLRFDSLIATAQKPATT